MPAAPNTIFELLHWAKEALAAATVEEAGMEAELLLAEVLKLPRYLLHIHPQQEVSSSQTAAYRALIKRRQAHEPFAYIVGHREFYSLDFIVEPGVLIPRPETELLVDLVLDIAKRQTVATITDVGTGSGAIACALGHELPKARVLALDISPKALEIAQKNVRALGLEKQVTVQKSDFLETAPFGMDVIVSNPPYIPSQTITSLMPEVRQEPLLALDGGTDGLEPYRHLIPDSFAKLKSGGYLLMEHGFNQARDVQKIMAGNGFSNISSMRDLAGIERVTIGQKLEC